MSLPNPSMNFTPFDTLPAADLNDLVENIEALAAGTGLDNASVGATKVNFGGTGAGIWWEEIGRTTLSVAGDAITVNSLPNRRYLKLFISIAATGGTLANYLRLNNDSGSNYAARAVEDGASGSFASQTSILLAGFTTTADAFIEASILNVSSREKQILFQSSRFPSGAANVPNGSTSGVGKWSNTSSVISRIDVINLGAGDFAIGSEIIVLGHN